MLAERPAIRALARAVDAALGPGMAETLWARLPELFKIRAGHLVPQTDLENCKLLFKSTVRLVEVETHSFCNRTCWFCPNASIDRRSQRHYLPEATFLQLIADLGSIDFTGTLSFSRYNEPFADPIMEVRLRQTRSQLSGATLIAYSNGDYLDADRLRELARLGLDDLQVGIYLPNDVAWCPEVAERFLRRALRRLDLASTKRREIPGERIAYHAQVGAMAVSVFCPNYARYGTDRGGTVEGTNRLSIRKSPCFYTVTDVYVDYNGALMPCCHLRSDVPEHKSCSLGILDSRPGSIFRGYGSTAAAQWRSGMSGFGAKTGACAHCTARTWSDGPAGRGLFSLASAGRSILGYSPTPDTRQKNENSGVTLPVIQTTKGL